MTSGILISISWPVLQTQITDVSVDETNRFEQLKECILDGSCIGNSSACCLNNSNALSQLSTCVGDGSCIGGNITADTLTVGVLNTTFTCVQPFGSSCIPPHISTINGISATNFVLVAGSNIEISNLTDGLSIATVPNPTFVTMAVTQTSLLGSNTTCEAPMMPSCYDISNQACTTPLDPSCVPQNATFNTIIVYNLTVANGTTLEFPIGNQTSLYVDDLYVNNEYLNGTLSCTGSGQISPSCFDLGGYVCPLGMPLTDSCIPASIAFQDVTVTDTLTINQLVCTGGPLNSSCVSINGATCSSPISDSCAPTRVETINGILPDGALNYQINGGTGIGIVGGTNSITVNMLDTGVSPGTYSLASFVVNAQGQLTNVTSGSTPTIAITVPPQLLSISPSSITGSGTFTISLVNQTANTIFAGPTSGSPAIPTFRSLVVADLPQLTNGQLYIGVTNASVVASTLTGTPNQVIVTNGPGSITLSLPQDIGTASSPTFASTTLTSGNLVLGTATIQTTSSSSYILPDPGANSNIVVDTAGPLFITNTPIVGEVLIATSATTSTWQSLPNVVKSKLTVYNLADSPATFTFQPNTQFVELVLISGGGGGGSGALNSQLNSAGGGAGGGVSSIFAMFPSSFFTASVSVIIGAGGIGAPGVSVIGAGGTGGNGGLSSFGAVKTSVAPGGAGGTTSGAYTAPTNSFSPSQYGYTSTGATVAGSNGGGTPFLSNLVPDRLAISIGATMGGGGGGYTLSNGAFAGQGGGNLIDYSGVIIAGGSLSVGNPASGFCYGGTGGGGATGTNSSSTGNSGYDGGLPGGAAGGGGGCAGGTISGAGGNGAAGRVYIVEHF